MIAQHAKEFAKRVLPLTWRRQLRAGLVSMNVRHLHGPKRLTIAPDEAAVTCVVKNGDFFMECFIEHYLGMGFRHIFFLDNGSTDNTIAIATRYPQVTVLQSTLPVEAHQALFKKYLAKTCVAGGWCFDADIDEYFDFPFSDRISLREFLAYLNEKEFTAVILQMLDMFSDRPLGRELHNDRNLTDCYRHYDTSEITRCSYRESHLALVHGAHNSLSDSRTALYVGGIRKTLFGHECLLTKHSLFVPEKVPQLFPHVHFVDGARLADLSCVIFHYKLTSNAVELARQNEDGFPGNRKLYADSIAFLQRQSGSVARPTACRLHNTNELLDNSFLFASDDYVRYCHAMMLRAESDDRVCQATNNKIGPSL